MVQCNCFDVVRTESRVQGTACKWYRQAQSACAACAQAVDKEACMSVAAKHNQWAHVTLRALGVQIDIWVGFVDACHKCYTNNQNNNNNNMISNVSRIFSTL